MQAENELSLSNYIARVMRRVYGKMSLGLLTTALTSFAVLSSPSIMSVLFSHQAVFWVLMAVELGLVIAISAAINKLSTATATALFYLYSVVNGIVLTPIFMVYTMSSIGFTFLITSLTFGAMTIFGYVTKQDLTKFGAILFMGLIGLIICSLVNIFLQSSALEWGISIVGVLIFVGLTGMIDPIRPEVKAAVAECRTAGIRPIMITGDQLDTAVAIGKELGIIESADDAVLGAALDDMSDEELLNKVGTYSVYARVQPEHKVRIVKAWRARQMVTAMTGDGVNDAPAIKSADIGVGMGITGTDVTKNVADMILADDNFATIVSAVEEGRRIYANIRKCIQFLLATNISEVLSILIATILNFTILKPAHLLWINLITDSLPALALGMEEGEGDAMKQQPRSAREGVFAGGMDRDILYQGAATTLLVLIAYFVGEYIETGQWHIVASDDGITMAFLTMSMCEIFHSFNMRSRRQSIFTLSRQNLWLWGSAAMALLLTSVVIEIPALAALFEFTPISLKEYGIAMGLAILIIPIVEIVKAFQRAAARRRGEELRS